jgi:putative PIN family toxin of toxin-antitoxin system
VRVLLDTNILVSGILSAGQPPARLLHLWLQRRFELVTSERQLEELRAVLARPKITKRISPEETAVLVENLEQEAICARDLPVVDVSPDPDDNFILATAIAGAAELIVSGDQAGMLDLQEVSGIAIVTAREALERIESREDA